MQNKEILECIEELLAVASLKFSQEMEKQDKALTELYMLPTSSSYDASKIREHLLSPYTDHLAKCEETLTAAEDLNFLNRIREKSKAKRAVKRAKKQLQQTTELLELDSSSRLMSDISELLQRESSDKSTTKNEIIKTIKIHDSNASALENTIKKLKEFRKSILQHGNLNPHSSTIMQRISGALSSGNFISAKRNVEAINYRPPLSDSQCIKWFSYAQGILEEAVSCPVGLSETVRLTEIAVASTQLICQGLRPAFFSKSTSQPTPDKWLHLMHNIAWPLSFLHEAQWPIYWSAFKSAQDFAVTLDGNQANEDILTGEFFEKINTQLISWANPNIELFDFETPKAVMSTMRMAGTSSETMHGADIGILIDIHLGTLKVRKLALLQAKVSNGSTFRANIGSKKTGPDQKTQLEKLDTPGRDYYLFYNRDPNGGASFLPTVASIEELFARHGYDTELKGNERLLVETQKCGWDFATFFNFGLCTPGSGVGKELSSNESFKGLLDSLSYPPKRLFIASFNGTELTYELMQEIRSTYEGNDLTESHQSKNRGMTHRGGDFSL